jgi:hypothetical protein
MSLLIPEDAKQIAEAVFVCALCEGVATHLKLFVPSKSDAIQADKSSGFLRVSGFLGEIEMVISGTEIGQLQAYIEQRSAPEMHEKHLNYAPCFCVQCGKAYCAAHWQTSLVFDEGFYDCTDGVCPEGHEQMLDD